MDGLCIRSALLFEENIIWTIPFAKTIYGESGTLFNFRGAAFAVPLPIRRRVVWILKSFDNWAATSAACAVPGSSAVSGFTGEAGF